MEMEKDKIVFKGSHPDSLYRVATDSGEGASRVTKVLRMLRWPVALVGVCVALAVFVYFLMPDNMESRLDNENGTYWEPVVAAGHRPHAAGHRPRTSGHSHDRYNKKPENTNVHGTKPSEIDFYAAENDTNYDLTTVVETTKETIPLWKLPIHPVFPTHLTPEVQYGNEKADSDQLRTPKVLEDVNTDDSTLKPHITQKPEKPLAVFFKDFDVTTTTTATETITRAETVNHFSNNDQKQITKNVEEGPVKTHPSAYKEYAHKVASEHRAPSDHQVPLEIQEFYGRRNNNEDVNFTSGHSKLFGISIEDAEKMKSTTQSSLYNTRVSPTLPTWRDGDDTTTKKYPTNVYSEVQCRSTRLSVCRGVLPYDLAGTPASIGNVDISSLLSQIDYLVATNCSDRVRHFMCALLEPECNPPPYPPKMPCYSLCKAIVDNCEGLIPSELTPAFNCKQYSRTNCVGAKTPCYTREFPCSDGSCVPRDWMCDGTKDCSSGEDEATCIQCDKQEYRCSSGGCILKRWLCDGYADCPDGEDEHEETCGGRDEHTEGDAYEAGAEPAGSAPAPAVRRPNRVPVGRKGASHRGGEIESSKELLITSDSSNVLKRNYTRRPSASRLSPYHRTQSKLRHPNNQEHKEPVKQLTTEQNLRSEVELKKTEGEKTTQKNILENESIEDVNMGDLGFFDEFDKEGKDQAPNPAGQKGTPRRWTGAVPPPRTTTVLPPTKPTRLDKSDNKLDRVIDGAALLRKAAAAQAAEAAEDMAALNDTYVDKEDTDASSGPTASDGTAEVHGTPIAPASEGLHEQPVPASRGGPSRGAYGKTGQWSRAHTSPCPSGELRCVDGRCITLAQLCDGAIDCSDHADEDNCYT